MVMKGVGPVTIGRKAGWADSSAPFMLRHYAHLTADHLQQAAKALESETARHYLGTNCKEMDFSGVVENMEKAL